MCAVHLCADESHKVIPIKDELLPPFFVKKLSKPINNFHMESRIIVDLNDEKGKMGVEVRI